MPNRTPPTKILSHSINVHFLDTIAINRLRVIILHLVSALELASFRRVATAINLAPNRIGLLPMQIGLTAFNAVLRAALQAYLLALDVVHEGPASVISDLLQPLRLRCLESC